MKRTNHVLRGITSFSRLHWPKEVVANRPQATSGKLSSSSSSSNPAHRSDGVGQDFFTRVFCGLSLELFARSVISSDTVLPKAVETAGKIKPQLDLGFASDATPRRAATISLERRVVSKQ